MHYKREINYHDYEHYSILSVQNFQFIMCLYNISGQIVSINVPTLPSCWMNNGQPNLAHQKKKSHPKYTHNHNIETETPNNPMYIYTVIVCD